MATTPNQPDPSHPTQLAPARGIADMPGAGGGGNDSGRGGDNIGGDPPEPPRSGTPGSPFVVALTRPDDPTLDNEKYEIVLWDVIAATSKAMSFPVYSAFLDAFFDSTPQIEDKVDNAFLEKKRNSAIRRPFSSYGLDAWDLVTTATDIFVKHQAGALSDMNWPHNSLQPIGAPFADDGKFMAEENLLAQFRNKRNLGTYLELVRKKLSELRNLNFFSLSNDKLGIFIGRIESPQLVELIWSYWMEQGMLVQTMNAIAQRFQNATLPELADPLRNLATDPLRPLSNLLWGYVQTDGSRLPIARRAYEYAHAYGLDLIGKAVPPMRVVESRSRFLEAFHTLLQATLAFYKEHDDLTVKADGFPLLNLLTEVHTLLAEGAHNQFNDLPWTARSEMMAMQWLLARPEFREFLGGRIMVPYAEPWMDRVDTMKLLQGWTDTSITAFYWLATYSEQILLSIRYGNWSMITDGALAAAWAEHWRYQIQSYAHYYRQVTGVDLTTPVADTRDASRRFRQPSALISERNDAARRLPRRPVLPAPVTAVPITGAPRRRPSLLPPRDA